MFLFLLEGTIHIISAINNPTILPQSLHSSLYTIKLFFFYTVNSACGNEAAAQGLVRGRRPFPLSSVDILALSLRGNGNSRRERGNEGKATGVQGKEGRGMRDMGQNSGR